MKILITGGAGFIGSHLADFYLKKSDEVRIIDDLSTGSEQNITQFKDNSAFSFVNVDLLNYQELSDDIKWADRIYHMAAVVGVKRVLEDPLRVLMCNINGCERLLKTMFQSGSKAKVILASSSSVYGHATPAPQSEKNDISIDAKMDKLWSYALSKIVNETYGLSYYRTKHLPVIIARLFNCIGPRQTGQYGMVVPTFVTSAIQGDSITIFGDGNQTRSFCDVRDTVTMLTLLADTDKCIGEIINVGNDREISMNDLAKLVIKETNSSSSIKHIPYREAYGEDFVDVMSRRPDLTKLHQLIDFKPRWRLEETIREMAKLTSMV